MSYVIIFFFYKFHLFIFVMCSILFIKFLFSSKYLNILITFSMAYLPIFANSRTSVISGYVYNKISTANETHFSSPIYKLFIGFIDIFTLIFVSQNLLYSFKGCWSLFW